MFFLIGCKGEEPLTNLETILSEQEARRQIYFREQELIKGFRSNTPLVCPLWDKSKAAVEINDISDEIKTAGLLLYSAPFVDVWQGLYEPFVYDGDTLWNSSHDNRKVARVIEAWQNKRPLSPPFFVKHPIKPMGLIADGKHRLTVAKYMAELEPVYFTAALPFWVKNDEVEWVTKSIPKAILEAEYNKKIDCALKS